MAAKMKARVNPKKSEHKIGKQHLTDTSQKTPPCIEAPGCLKIIQIKTEILVKNLLCQYF